jgi:hypothetical protein
MLAQAQHLLVGDDLEPAIIAVPAQEGVLADRDAGGGRRDEIRAGGKAAGLDGQVRLQ